MEQEIAKPKADVAVVCSGWRQWLTHIQDSKKSLLLEIISFILKCGAITVINQRV